MTMFLNKWGCFPIGRPSIDLLEDHQRSILTKPFVFIRPAAVKPVPHPVQIWIAQTGLELDFESKPGWYRVLPGVGGRYEGPGRLSAVIHDEYCHRGRDLNNSPYASPEVHRVYYEACRCAGLNPWRAESRYLGVRKGGPQFGIGNTEDPTTKELVIAPEYTLEHVRTLVPEAYAALVHALKDLEGSLSVDHLSLLFADAP